ncbi:MAG TPA: hypothetical protein PLO89_10545, partial [Spirochaetota bacterium]|nr:hypothetical protein [Spirochaetota bacterium]
PIKNTSLRFAFRTGFVYKHYNTLNIYNNVEKWKWNDEKKEIYKEVSKTTKGENTFLFGIGNIDSSVMSDYPNPVNDSYLSSLSITGIRIPVLNCYTTFYLGLAYQSYINLQDTMQDFTQFRIKPTASFHFPLNMIMANLYVNLGVNYTGRYFTYGVDKKKYLENIFRVSLNADSPADNPINARIVFNLNKINSSLALYAATAYHSQSYTEFNDFSKFNKNSLETLVANSKNNYSTFPGVENNFKKAFLDPAPKYYVDNAIKSVGAIEYTLNIPSINAYVTNRTDVIFWKWFRTKTINNSVDIIDKYLYDTADPTDNKFYISEFSVAFTKRIPLDNRYLIKVQADGDVRRKVDSYNNFAVKFNLCFPDSANYLFQTYNKKGEIKVYPNNLVFAFDLAYNLYLPVYKENAYKMRMWIFGRVNGVKNYASNGSSYYDSSYLDYWFREGRASKIGYFGGFAG